MLKMKRFATVSRLKRKLVPNVNSSIIKAFIKVTMHVGVVRRMK